MPDWFPNFVDKFVGRSIGKKIDADFMEYTNPDLPNIKLSKSDDGKILIEGRNEFSESYNINYEPPGYEVLDYKTGKSVKTKGEFRATDAVPESSGAPDNLPDYFPEQLDSVDDILSSDARIMEEFATGKKIKEMKRGEFNVGQAEAKADAARKGEDFAKGGLAGQLL